MIRKLALLLFISFYFNSYSQVGEYVSEEYINSYNNKYLNFCSFLNLKEDKTFDLIIMKASDMGPEKKESCSEINGKWIIRDIFLYLEDKENNQVYYFIISNDRLIDPNLYKLLEIVDVERNYPITNEDYDNMYLNSYLQELGLWNDFTKTKSQSDLNNFEQLKEQICK